MFRRAIALDASFARAYAALALTYAADYRNHWTLDGSAALERAFELARSAAEMNPELRETYSALAFGHLERREHAQVLRYLETAVQLYPSFADAYAFMGGVKTYMGRAADAVPLVRTATSSRRASASSTRCGATPRTWRPTSTWRCCTWLLATKAPRPGKPTRSVSCSPVSPAAAGSKRTPSPIPRRSESSRRP